MDSLKKRTKYELIVEEIMSMIEDAYRRALGGIERDTLREKTMVHQNLNPMGQPYQMGGAGSNSQKKVSMMKPWTWF